MRGLPGDRVTNVDTRRGTRKVTIFADGAQFRDYFKRHYGPTIAAYTGLADDTAKVAALDHDLAELGRRFDLGGGAMEWEYLTARFGPSVSAVRRWPKGNAVRPLPKGNVVLAR